MILPTSPETDCPCVRAASARSVFLAQNIPGCLCVWGRMARLVLQNSGCRWMCRNIWRCPPGAKLRGSRRYLALANVDPAEAGVDSGCRWMCRSMLCSSERYLALANVDPAGAGVALLRYLLLRPVIGPPRPDTSCGNTTCEYQEFEASLAPARLLEEGSGWAARDKSATGASRSDSFRLKPWLSNCCVAARSRATASTIVGLVPPATS